MQKTLTPTQKASKVMISSLREKECKDYQEYEAYEDHVDSFVLNYPKQGEIERTSSTPQGFARKAIIRRVKNKMRQQVSVNSYGEYLYGDYVESPAYDDYLEYNSGDSE